MLFSSGQVVLCIDETVRTCSYIAVVFKKASYFILIPALSKSLHDYFSTVNIHIYQPILLCSPRIAQVNSILFVKKRRRLGHA